MNGKNCWNMKFTLIRIQKGKDKMKNLALKALLLVIVILSQYLPTFSSSYVDNKIYKTQNLTSFRVLTKQFQTDFDKKRNSKEAEDAYLDIMDYYYDFLTKQNENINVNKIFIGVNDDFKKYQYSFYPFGLLIQFDDGGFSFQISHKYIYEYFAPYLSNEWQELLEYEIYLDKQIKFDGRYIISKSEIQQIKEFYENFKIKYPEFSKKFNIDDLIELFEIRLRNYPFVS